MAKITAKNIAEAIYRATEGKSKEDLAIALKRSARLIQRAKMLGKSDEVLKAIQDIFDQKSGTLRARITSALPLSKEKKAAVERDIKERYKAQNIASEYFEKPEVLGGIRIQVRDEVWDSTHQTKLRELEEFLVKGK